MKITKAKAQRDGVIKAEVDGVELFIPPDPGNRHYLALLEAKIAIEEADPEPAPTPAPVPLTTDALLQALIDEGVIKGGAAKLASIKATYAGEKK